MPCIILAPLEAAVAVAAVRVTIFSAMRISEKWRKYRKETQLSRTERLVTVHDGFDIVLEREQSLPASHKSPELGRIEQPRLVEHPILVEHPALPDLVSSNDREGARLLLVSMEDQPSLPIGGERTRLIIVKNGIELGGVQDPRVDAIYEEISGRLNAEQEQPLQTFDEFFGGGPNKEIVYERIRRSQNHE